MDHISAVERLVVALDGSPQANAALPLATGLAQAIQVPVVLVRVAATPAEQTAAQAQLAGVLHEIARNQVDVTSEVRIGLPSYALRDLLTPADLVLFGLAGRPDLGALPRAILDDTSNPVLFRRAGGRRVMRVRAIAVDSTPAIHALAADLAVVLGAALVDDPTAADLLVVPRTSAALACDPGNPLPVLVPGP